MLRREEGKSRIIIWGSVLSVALSLYIGAWFYSAHHLKKILHEAKYADEHTILTYDNINITGFPFKLKAKLSKLYFRHRINNSFINANLEISSDSIAVKTNLLFNHAVIRFPNETSVNFIYNNKPYKFEIIPDQNHFLEIEDSNKTNIYKLIKGLYYKKMPEFKDFSIEKISYHAQNLSFLDGSNKDSLLESTAKLNSYFNYSSNDKLSGVKLASNNAIKIIDSSKIDSFFNNFSSEVDLSASLKDFGNIFAIRELDVRSLKLGMDKFKLSLVGNSTIEDSGQNAVNFKLKCSNLKSVLDKLLERKTISSNQLSILENFIHSITGEENIDEIDVKIYNSKDNSLRVGITNMDTITSYLQQLILSK